MTSAEPITHRSITHQSMPHAPTPQEPKPPMATRIPGYLAASMATGLATAHLTVYTVGYLRAPETPLSAYLLGGVAVAAVALLFAGAALALTLRRASDGWTRMLRVVSWIAAAVLTLQALLIAVAEPGLLVQLAGPGPWSVLGGPAFAALAWRSRRRKRAA